MEIIGKKSTFTSTMRRVYELVHLLPSLLGSAEIFKNMCIIIDEITVESERTKRNSKKF